MRKTQNLRDLLAELTRTRDFEPKMLEQKVFMLWRECLGTPLGTRTVPVSLSNGVLKIYTEYPPFTRELLFHKQRIIADLNSELGQPILTDLRIELRQLCKATPPHTSGALVDEKTSKTMVATPDIGDAHTLTPEELEQIEQAIAGVTDADLKISLRQLFCTQSKDKS